MSNPKFQAAEDIRGRVAVVTGAGRGIGRAIALTLAAAGMTVVALARSESDLREATELAAKRGGHVEGLTVDVTNRAQVESAIARIERVHGGVHVLVNNAGQLGPIGPFHETDIEAWWGSMEVNLLGAIHCMRAAATGMVERRYGRIINIVASAVPFAFLSSYVTSKTALTRLTEIVGAELEPHGVRVIGLVPGTARTAMTEHSLHSPAGRRWLPWFERIFAERLDVSPELPANYVLHLASGRGDALAGRTVSVADDLDVLSENIRQIELRGLQSLRLQGLASPSGKVAEAIRQEGERGFQTMQIQRSLAAPPGVVFQLWVEPVSVHSWFVYHANVHWARDPLIEARAGGRYDWEVIDDEDTSEVFHFQGTYQQFKRGAHLSFSWNWERLPIDVGEGPGRTRVEIAFVQEGQGTKLTIRQTGFATPAARNAHVKGRGRCLDGMAALLGQDST